MRFNENGFKMVAWNYKEGVIPGAKKKANASDYVKKVQNRITALNNLGKAMLDEFTKTRDALLEAWKPVLEMIKKDYHLYAYLMMR